MSEREPSHGWRAPRVASRHRAVLIDSDGRAIDGIVTNISKGGFRVTAREPLLVGERVRVRVDRFGDFPAQIRWNEGLDSGGIFLEPVNLD